MPLSVVEREAKDAVRRQSIALSGLYAWAATVLYPVTLHGASTLARVTAGLAAALLGAGVALGTRPPLGRAFGLHAFVGASVVTWMLLGPLIAPDHLDPARAALGAVGWMLFAFAWGAPREPRGVPEDDPHFVPGEPLPPRNELPRRASLVLAVATAGAALPLALAFRVTRTYHSLFGHAVAVACAVALVSAGADIAVRRGKWVPVEPASRRLAQAMVPLVLVGMILLAGAVALVSG
ncbi:MAG TPA: hypothetical protein VHE30_15915 [Polyangiaceae bacterium]|nr:hypothetical protein [Polyangiaceae bacterium]